MKIVRTFLLVLAVSVCAHAGEMDNGVTALPQPTPAPVVQEPTTDGIMPNGATDGIMDNGAAATFAQVLLNLLALS